MLMSTIGRKRSLGVCIVSSGLRTSGRIALLLHIVSFGKGILAGGDVGNRIPTGTSALCCGRPCTNVAADPRGAFLLVALGGGGNRILSRRVCCFGRTGSRRLPGARVHCGIGPVSKGCRIALSTERLTESIFVRVPIRNTEFASGFFSLLPKRAGGIVVASSGLGGGRGISVAVGRLDSAGWSVGVCCRGFGKPYETSGNEFCTFVLWREDGEDGLSSGSIATKGFNGKSNYSICFIG